MGRGCLVVHTERRQPPSRIQCISNGYFDCIVMVNLLMFRTLVLVGRSRSKGPRILPSRLVGRILQNAELAGAAFTFRLGRSCGRSRR